MIILITGKCEKSWKELEGPEKLPKSGKTLPDVLISEILRLNLDIGGGLIKLKKNNNQGF